jgi:hypothetical protein
MNALSLTTRIEKFGILMLSFFFSALTFAQEKAPDLNVDVTTTKTTTTEEWFTNPLYWVIGALLVIILIAVIARGNKRD